MAATLLDELRELLQLDQTDERLGIVSQLIDVCRYEAKKVTNNDNVSDYVIKMMVVERYNRWRHEGFASVSIGGATETYLEGYSDLVIRLLKGESRLKTI